MLSVVSGAGACPDIFDRGGTRGGLPLTGHIANHILRYWGGQSDFRGGPCHPRPLPEHATAQVHPKPSSIPAHSTASQTVFIINLRKSTKPSISDYYTVYDRFFCPLWSEYQSTWRVC